MNHHTGKFWQLLIGNKAGSAIYGKDDRGMKDERCVHDILTGFGDIGKDKVFFEQMLYEASEKYKEYIENLFKDIISMAVCAEKRYDTLMNIKKRTYKFVCPTWFAEECFDERLRVCDPPLKKIGKLQGFTSYLVKGHNILIIAISSVETIDLLFYPGLGTEIRFFTVNEKEDAYIESLKAELCDRFAGWDEFELSKQGIEYDFDKHILFYKGLHFVAHTNDNGIITKFTKDVVGRQLEFKRAERKQLEEQGR